MSLGRVVLGFHGRLRVAGSIPVACGDPAVAPFFFSCLVPSFLLAI